MDTRTIFGEFIYGVLLFALILGYPLFFTIGLVHGLGKCIKNMLSAPKSIREEVALITGSGRGLGRCIAIGLAKLGCHVAIVDIQGKLAQETAEFISRTYSVTAVAYKVDITDYEQLLELRTKVYQDLGQVTILINNAGIVVPSDHINTPPHEVQNMINVNFTAMQYCIQLFLPAMKKLNRGRIVNISSMTSAFPCAITCLYGATKAGVRNLSAALRIHLLQTHSNITITTMLPTFLSTNDRINRLVNLLKAYRLGPRVDGDVMARYVMKAMLRGDREVAVPRVLYYIDVVFETLPAYVRELGIAILTYDLANRMHRDEVKAIVENLDINANS